MPDNNNTYWPIDGVEKAYVAFDVLDTDASYSAGTPEELGPVVKAVITEAQSTQAIYGSNSKLDDAFGVVVRQVVLTITGVSEKMHARLRGEIYNEATGRIAGYGNPRPPLCALNLVCNKGDEYTCMWFLKGRFSGGDITGDTRKEASTLNNRQYTLSVYETKHKWTIQDALTGQEKTTGLMVYKGDTTDPAFDGTGWLAQVQTPDTTGAPAAIALSSIVPADAATGVALDAAVVLTFNNKIADDNVILLDGGGEIVEATKAYDTTGKVLTITPDADMTASTAHRILVIGVMDVYGQALASTSAGFTTASE